jgi:hypothetical protein
VKPVLDWVSNVSLVPMVLLLAAANIDKISTSSAHAASSLDFY